MNSAGCTEGGEEGILLGLYSDHLDCIIALDNGKMLAEWCHGVFVFVFYWLGLVSNAHR